MSTKVVIAAGVVWQEVLHLGRKHEPILLKTAKMCGNFLGKCEFIVYSSVVFIIDISDSMLVHSSPQKEGRPGWLACGDRIIPTVTAQGLQLIHHKNPQWYNQPV